MCLRRHILSLVLIAAHFGSILDAMISGASSSVDHVSMGADGPTVVRCAHCGPVFDGMEDVDSFEDAADDIFGHGFNLDE